MYDFYRVLQIKPSKRIHYHKLSALCNQQQMPTDNSLCQVQEISLFNRSLLHAFWLLVVPIFILLEKSPRIKFAMHTQACRNIFFHSSCSPLPCHIFLHKYMGYILIL